MAFQLSPGVNVSEVDLTTVVPSVATTVGGLAGQFAWGPVEEITIISNEVRLADTFGKPDANTYGYFYTAANFLSYGSDLRVIRANSAALNATTSATGRRVKNRLDYESNASSGSGSDDFIAKYPGALGNNLSVSISDSASHGTWSFSGYFDSAPSTSEFVSSKGGTNDELHIVVIDRTGKISGTANTVLERFAYVSKASDAKSTDGSSNYYKEVINSRSKYIWWGKHNTDGTNWGTAAAGVTFASMSGGADTFTLSGGTDADASSGNLQTAWDLFKNPDAVDVSLMMTGPSTGNTIPNYVTSIAETRKDALVFISPRQSDVVNASGSEATNVSNYRDTLTSSSYGVLDSGYKYQYDKYNDVYRWIPLNGDIAGLCVRTDVERDPWFSPAGFNRGVIKNVVKLSWNPTKAERDVLYKKGVNPVVTFPGEGTVLYGDKTMLAKPSAFDRINVRRLFIVLEKAIAKAARSSLFEFNDEFTRAAFVNLVEPYLRDVQGRRGIYDFKVVCDTTNNNAQVIDANQFVGDIYIKPARSINYIQLNFVAVRTGVSFEEVVGQF
jgi:phage tail sheath protein FI